MSDSIVRRRFKEDCQMNKKNSGITFKGQKMRIVGKAVREGSRLPRFKVTATDMSDIDNKTFEGKVLLISAVPSLDTPVCSLETKRFNDEVAKLSDDVVLLTVSMDLPFAQLRWCGASGSTRVQTASDYKYGKFGEAFGAYIKDLGLLTRSVFVADRTGKVVYVEYVPEITQEPDYASALAKVRELV